MEPAPGFEPGTDGLQNRCSTTELRRPVYIICKKFIRKYTKFGRGEIRTLGGFHLGGLVNRCNRPLCHPSIMEDEVGFEPTVPFKVLRISSAMQ